ncbi:MAG: hypothetical protein ABI597_13710 [Gammaproteobacteria bacterium]
MLPDLPTLLEYKNIHVLNRYANDYPNNKITPEEAFEELMKYFWLNLKHEADKICYPENQELDFICGIHSEMKEIDDMWHTFLLFTKEYISFCKKYFGKYFHHSPTTDDEQITKNDFEIDFTRFLSYVYDNLGESTLKKWFGTLIQLPIE